MRTEPVPAPRHVVVDRGDAVRVEMPIQRRTTRAAYLALVLVMMAGLVGILALMVWGILRLLFVPDTLVVLSAFGVISVIVVVLLFVSVWALVAIWTGQEVLDIDGTAVCVRRIVRIAGAQLTLPRPIAYSTQHVWGLRVNSGVFGGLAFDYGAATVRFGFGVDEAEAKLILRAILARFPKLGAEEAEH